jgi:NADPH-dependent F420 reductase
VAHAGKISDRRAASPCRPAARVARGSAIPEDGPRRPRRREDGTLADASIAIIGGTGEQGLGLALRFAKAGRALCIGSRDAARALEAAARVRERVPGAQVSGLENGEAARQVGGGVVILSVPFEHTASTLRSLRDALQSGATLVSMGVPLASAIGDSPTRLLGVPQGSVAELCASLVPQGVSVAAAFQNVSAHRLAALEAPVECDVIVCGPPPARSAAMALCELIPGLRAIDGGPLHNARHVEALTALLIGINRRHKLPEGVGVRLTYL